MLTLESVLMAKEFSDSEWLFLSENEPWALSSKAFAARKSEVPAEGEDDAKVGYPELAIKNQMMDTLPMSEVGSIVENTLAQIPKATSEELLKAFLYYYDNDAFIDWSQQEI